MTNAFKNQQNISSFLCSSSLFRYGGPSWSEPAETDEDRQLSAKLHVLYGLSVESLEPDAAVIHPYARSRVYDLRRYTEHNLWGPFRNDGSQEVDWEKVQCIMIVLGFNLRAFSERAHGQFEPFKDRPFAGTAPNSFTPLPSNISHIHNMGKPEAPLPIAAEDPYGVTGTWRRIVCFLDYNDLYAFNFESEEIPLSQERGPIDTQEAIRLITLKLRVTRIEPPSEDDHPDWPVVHFNGSSRSMLTSWDPNANS